MPPAERLKQRYAKFRAFGHYVENQPVPDASSQDGAPAS